jgi:hypothetical protein
LRKIWYAILTGLAFMFLAFWVLKLDYDRTFSIGSDSYRFLADLGMLLLFLVFLLFMGISTWLSRKLRATRSLLAGIVAVIVAVGGWSVAAPLADVHTWTMTLVVFPLTMFLSGSVLLIVGAIRWVIQRFCRPPLES